MKNLRYKNQNQQDRNTSSWTAGEVLCIRLWAIVWILFARWTPKMLNGWRLVLLRLFGAKIEGRPFVFSSSFVHVPWNLILEDGACLGPKSIVYSLGKVTIRVKAVVSQECYICGGTHDLTSPRMPLMVGDIDIGRNVFMGARAFVLPGVTIGDEAVVGAMAVVTKDIAAHQVVGGNPAKVIGERYMKCESAS